MTGTLRRRIRRSMHWIKELWGKGYTPVRLGISNVFSSASHWNPDRYKWGRTLQEAYFPQSAAINIISFASYRVGPLSATTVIRSESFKLTSHQPRISRNFEK
jgi:hypothetical protein